MDGYDEVLLKKNSTEQMIENKWKKVKGTRNQVNFFQDCELKIKNCQLWTWTSSLTFQPALVKCERVQHWSWITCRCQRKCTNEHSQKQYFLLRKCCSFGNIMKMFLCAQESWIVSLCLIETGFEMGRFRQTAEKILLDRYLAAGIESQWLMLLVS